MRWWMVFLSLGLNPASWAQAPEPDAALEHSVQQLRAAVGRWDVRTSYLNPDGGVAQSVDGTYEFEWVIPDRVLRGRSDMPARQQTSAILFYIEEKAREIEMVSVGADGRLWVMTGPLGEEVRTSQEFPTQDGKIAQLRFTRFNVGADGFESKMEYTEDGGKTWQPGNHQVFRRSGGGR